MNLSKRVPICTFEKWSQILAAVVEGIKKDLDVLIEKDQQDTITVKVELITQLYSQLSVLHCFLGKLGEKIEEDEVTRLEDNPGTDGLLKQADLQRAKIHNQLVAFTENFGVMFKAFQGYIEESYRLLCDHNTGLVDFNNIEQLAAFRNLVVDFFSELKKRNLVKASVFKHCEDNTLWLDLHIKDLKEIAQCREFLSRKAKQTISQEEIASFRDNVSLLNEEKRNFYNKLKNINPTLAETFNPANNQSYLNSELIHLLSIHDEIANAPQTQKPKHSGFSVEIPLAEEDKQDKNDRPRFFKKWRQSWKNVKTVFKPSSPSKTLND